MTYKDYKSYDSFIESVFSNSNYSTREKLPLSDENYVCYEWHHIKPKCFGGKDAKDNLILLTCEEHIIAHQLLCKKYKKGARHYKMLCALIELTSMDIDTLLDSIDIDRSVKLLKAKALSESIFCKKSHKIYKKQYKGLTSSESLKSHLK